MACLRHLLLLVLMFALPFQGALAASRLCVALVQPVGDALHQHHADASDDSHEAHHPAGASHDHAGSCSMCAACLLTVAAAPDAPHVAPALATYVAHLPFTVPVPHNVADGLERPPRTI